MMTAIGTGNLRRQRLLKRVLPATVAIFIGGAGVYLLTSTRAAVPVNTIEAENGLVEAGAVKVIDDTASSGSAIRFSSQTGFKHPGVYVDKAQLDFVKGKLASGSEPWVRGYDKFYSWTEAPTYTPYPTSPFTLDCAASATACSELLEDSITAYTQALIYYLKGNRAAAQNSIKILNTWSANLKASKDNQAKLTMAWSGETMLRAAEIMRHTHTPQASETALNVQNFKTMLDTVYTPAFDERALAATSSNGNWDLSFINATMSIAVFNDDRSLFNNAVERWRKRVPAYVYLTSDGGTPVRPPGGLYDDPSKLRCFWLASGSATGSCPVPSGFRYANGMVQETCRDVSHVISGLSSAVYAAETARIQGTDLYSEGQTRLVAAHEFTAKHYNTYLTTGSWPTDPCGQAPTNGEGGTNAKQGWEVAYNAYANRLGLTMPETEKMISKFRPTGASNQFAWETLIYAAR